MFLVTIGYRCGHLMQQLHNVSVTKQTLGHRTSSHFCRPDLQFGVEEMETMMSRTTNGLTMQCTRATNSIDPSID